MFLVTKLLSFEAAHQLGNGYVGKCNNLHGHSYKVEITVQAQTLNKHGMVIDFSEIKRIWEKNLDPITDHCLLEESLVDEKGNKIFGEGLGNATAESMSRYFFMLIQGYLENLFLENNPRLQKIRVWETATSYAEYSESL